MKRFRHYLAEANALRLLDDTDGRSFGIINGGKSEESTQSLRALLNNAGYNLIWIEGTFTIPAKSEKEKAQHIPDLSFVVIAPEKEDPDQLRSFLFKMAVRFKYPNFLFRPKDQTRLFAIGAEEHKWPGLKMMRPFAEYTNTRFVSIIERYKGDKYAFEDLIEDRDVRRDDKPEDEPTDTDKSADAPTKAATPKPEPPPQKSAATPQKSDTPKENPNVPTESPEQPQ